MGPPLRVISHAVSEKHGDGPDERRLRVPTSVGETAREFTVRCCSNDWILLPWMDSKK
jgi:hypothetical protein